MPLIMPEPRLQRYEILRRHSAIELAVAVEAKLNDGWHLAGGPFCVVEYKNGLVVGNWWYQALVQDLSEEN